MWCRTLESADFTPEQARFVADAARYLAEGARRAEDAPAAGLARARVRADDGRWIVFHGTILEDERAAVILEPARPPEIAPLIADAYGLSDSERGVTRLVLQGLSTREIASTLCLSPYTVQGHLKAIFEKAGVRSRRELVAQVFFRHYAPNMGAGENLASNGWFDRQAVPR
jgi:DNA-binding CsgD family transcriptional regulator